jgi:hypothetical protein
MLTAAAVLSANALAVEYTMSCDDVVTKLNLEATGEAKARFADMEGSCLGVVERDGNLYMHTKMVIRRVRGNNITIYLPATDETFTVRPDPAARVVIAGRKVRPRDLARGQELNFYVSVDEFTQPVIDEVAFETETDEIVVSPAAITAALPTTG